MYSPSAFYLGFDFGYKKIGLALGQGISANARPLTCLKASQGVPDWEGIRKLIQVWQPAALIVGLPTTLEDTPLYTTKAAKRFAKALEKETSLPVVLVDERLSTIEAKARLFAAGGYKKLQSSQVDSIAACIILEQWLQRFNKV